LESLSTDQLLKKAKTLILNGKITDANVIYEALLQRVSNENNLTQLFEQNQFLDTKLPEETPPHLLERLIELYENGESLEAFQTATALLSRYPNNYVLWNLLGASAIQTGQFDEAVTAFLKVIELKPDYEQAYNNLGIAYTSKEQLEHAFNAFKNALRINPNYVDALNNFGQLLIKTGDIREAIASFKKAISIRPDFASAYYNLGSSFYAEEDWGQSIEALNKAISLQPYFAPAYNDLGNALRKVRNLDDSIAAYKHAVAIQSNFVDAYNNLGVALNDIGEFEAALESLHTAVALDSSYFEAYNNIGTVLIQQDEFEEAIKFYEIAIRVEPEYAEAYNNLGTTLKDLGRYEEAMEAYGSAIQVKVDYAEAYNNLGRLYWLMQDFTRAFELMEWRWRANEQFIGKKLESTHPTWNGEELAEVFVWKEQGIGDEIMFSSMLSELNAKSKKLIVECDKRLIPLYERSFSKDIRFIADRHKLSDFDYDSQIAIGSLPKHFRHKLEDFTNVSPGWLEADLDRSKVLREKLKAQADDIIIGISWCTQSAGLRSYKRNIPLELLAEYLKRVPGKYINLQYGDTAEEILEVKNQVNFELHTVDEIDLYNDIDGLAALISACDTVISIDNLTVHLAGALGIDTRVLLPEVPEDRWGITGSNTYWYDHLALYRQESKYGWENQLERLTQDLLNS